ncbi:MAG: glycosyltransferase family 39 protein [Elusimicrobiota bacterium]|jgi:hypothetical protein|nr:glycosyltransferase family 39 protein [Elusimicrobiota bacterium]
MAISKLWNFLLIKQDNSQERMMDIFCDIFVLTMAIKILLSISVPITSDEAYFVLWGRYPALGYYDHPPMIGWILYLLQLISSSTLIMRLPAIVFSQMISIGIYIFLKQFDEYKAVLAALFWLVSPINILNVLVTTDAPLLLFSFLSVISLYYAVNKQNYLFYILSGLSLGAAFLSKYFAVLLGLSYLIYYIASEKTYQKTIGFIIIFAIVLPFGALNFYYNYENGWTNIMFNLINRNQNESFKIIKPIAFILCQLYLLTPPIVYYVFKKRKNLRELIFGDRYFNFFAIAFIVPLMIFAVISLKKMVGLHWLLSFYPIVYILSFILLSKIELLKSIRFMAVFSFFHILIIFIGLSLPLPIIQNNRNYPIVIASMYPKIIINYFKQYENEFYFAAPSYADSAIFEFYYRKHVAVFGSGSYHARQDDILTDWIALNDKNIMIVCHSRQNKEKYQPFFEKVEITQVSIKGAAFYFVFGYNFDYEAYKDTVLSANKKNFYNIPKFLPIPPSNKYQFAKYFK